MKKLILTVFAVMSAFVAAGEPGADFGDRGQVEQLAVGGRLVMPVGEQDQELVLIERTEEGFSRQAVEAVRFVPLVRGDAGSTASRGARAALRPRR